DTADFGILRLIVIKVDLARKVLKENGFTVGKTNVIAVEVPDQAGGLAGVLKTVETEGLNVEYMYAFVNKTGENAVLIFRFDEMDKAIQSLQKAGLTLLSGEQVCAL
ncbi:MAG TPA: amino acid-binding protein, partial [Desulfobulbaceae bacterium]|nr:amino acid-binding protein [Desulfobulbaceae bacterium]